MGNRTESMRPSIVRQCVQPVLNSPTFFRRIAEATILRKTQSCPATATLKRARRMVELAGWRGLRWPRGTRRHHRISLLLASIGQADLGIGPVVVLPSTSGPTLGAGRWCAGPSLLVRERRPREKTPRADFTLQRS